MSKLDLIKEYKSYYKAVQKPVIVEFGEGWLSVEKIIEDRCVQIMHISPYLREPESINKLLKLVVVNGFTVNGLHHEIYLSNPRKTDPEKLTTIISYPFK